MALGVVKSVIHERGFGFVTPDDGGTDVFFHYKVLNKDIYEVRPGMRCTYEEEEFRTARGPRAASVDII
jgi:cold shock protein